MVIHFILNSSIIVAIFSKHDIHKYFVICLKRAVPSLTLIVAIFINCRV